MKKFFFLTIFFLVFFSNAQNLPNDCANFIQVCGNQQISLDVSGMGIQEIVPPSCYSEEHNSLWLRVTIETSGTLGFDLIPQSTDIQEDYDFWVFGPNVSCNNLGSTIRCSTTNPQAAGQKDNHTGMNDTETDYSEGPGKDGNSYIKSLNVLAGETYFIVLDRPIGNSAFTLNWTGTAKILDPFKDSSLHFGSIPDIVLCDNDGNNSETYDFSQLSAPILNGNSDFSISYFSSEQDATIGANELLGNVPVSTGVYYAKIEHSHSRCFEIKKINVTLKTYTAEDTTKYICDDNNDGSISLFLSSIDITTSLTGTYKKNFFGSLIKATNGNIQDILPDNFSTNLDTSVFVRVENSMGCFAVAEVKLFIKNTFTLNSVKENVCDDDTDGKLIFDISSFNKDIYTGNQQLNYHYFKTSMDAQNDQNEILNFKNYGLLLGDNIFYVKADNFGCTSIAILNIALNSNPTLGADEMVTFCPEEIGVQLSAPSGFTYNWLPGKEVTQTIFVKDLGVYHLKIIDQFGCSDEKDFTVKYKEIPIISDVFEEKGNVSILSENKQTLQYSIDDGKTWQNLNYFTNLNAGVYFARIKFPQGCVSLPFKFIVLKYANVFTPNGDGINDTWNIDFLNEYENAQIQIYDRYGKIVLEKVVKMPFSWNGNSISTGNYWYLISLPNGKKITGWIFLKR